MEMLVKSFSFIIQDLLIVYVAEILDIAHFLITNSQNFSDLTFLILHVEREKGKTCSTYSVRKGYSEMVQPTVDS